MMNFSMVRSLQGTVRNIVNNILTPKSLSVNSVPRIHGTCTRYLSMLNTTNYQNIHSLANVTTSLLLRPKNFLATTIPLFNQVCGLKVKGNLIRRCKGCYYVAREGKLYVMCKLKPRHKQVQMQKHFKNRRILTFAQQKKQRDW